MKYYSPFKLLCKPCNKYYMIKCMLANNRKPNIKIIYGFCVKTYFIFSEDRSKTDKKTKTCVDFDILFSLQIIPRL